MIIRKYEVIDDIKVFDKVEENHSDYNAKGLDNLYKAENKHFWFIARKEFILQNLKKHINKNAKIIEIGAGTGNVSRYFMQNGYENAVGEMHFNGLKYAKSYGIKDCYQFNLLNIPFEKEFDVVCMFDVLEHIEDDNLALQNIHKALNGGGKIVLTVPAHMWLWNRDDRIGGHKRRYTKKELKEKLEKNGFKVINIRYFFIGITPLLYLRTILNKDDGSEVKENELNKEISMNSILNSVLLFVSRLENRINRFLPNLFGGSIFAIGEKIDTIQ